MLTKQTSHAFLLDLERFPRAVLMIFIQNNFNLCCFKHSDYAEMNVSLNYAAIL